VSALASIGCSLTPTPNPKNESFFSESFAELFTVSVCESLSKKIFKDKTKTHKRSEGLPNPK